MLSYTAKRLYFLVASPFMRLNGAAFRVFRQPKKPIRVHLGPGQRNYIEGWLNVDANMVTAKTDLWTDFMRGLPFRDGSVEAIYSHHVIEHIRDDLLQHHFNEMFRVLMPGGAVRVGGPNAHAAIMKYLDGDMAWFSDFPRKRKSVGGRMVNFIFCANEHLTALTPSYLEELMTTAGFVDVRFCVPTKESHYFGRDLLEKEHESNFEFPHTLIVEGCKRASQKQDGG